ncbi:MAG: AsmA-like C-terminal domain-containing protein [Tepidisphaeraceae bacterium]
MLLLNPERLFERSWRPRHPLRRQHCAARRWSMASLLLVLCLIIFGYIYLTDSERVRAMASSYLSDLLGGEVTIGKANLSIFEGLRLDDVTLQVDQTHRPDSIIFHARTFLIRFHPTQLLAGQLEATQIVAIDPVVLLVEDPSTHRWNYDRMWHGAGPMGRRRANGAGGPLVLPQIILRDAEVAYMELRDGKTVPMGWYAIGGSLNPNDEEADRYDFQLQSRGRESMGPSADGTIRTQGGVSVARLQNFTFGPDIKTMLLSQPRQWCEWHQLQGRIDVPEMIYNPNPGGGGPIFRVELDLSDVEMALHPEEWMTREQNQRVQAFHRLLDTAQGRHWLSPAWAQVLRRLSTPEPIHFGQVSGNMVFTEQGIELKDLSGKLESNWFNVDGKIAGYSPDAPARLTLSSVNGHDLELPEFSPEYLGSLPREVQEVIERLHPKGTCGLRLVIERAEAGGKPTVSGQIDIHDGEFRFNQFPFPVSHVNGRVTIGDDPIAKMRGFRVLNLQGHGPSDGPNANALITLNGFVGPLDGDAGVWLEVNGSNMVGDAVVRGALSPAARRALKMFDPDGSGQLPRGTGDFSCHIFRPIGPHKHFRVETDVNLYDAEASLAAFPYPIKHLTARLEIQDGLLKVVNGRMPHGDSTIHVEGTVRWWDRDVLPTTQPYGPDLRITASNLPIDDDLINAIPERQRAWVQGAGLGGRLDIDGHVFPKSGNARGSEVNYVFDASLHDGKVQPDGGEAAMSGLTGRLRLTPGRLELGEVSGVRGDSAVAGHALIDWASGPPKIAITASAKELQLSPSLYRMLPEGGRKGWDLVHPHGTVDATLEFADTIGAAPDRLELLITPRDLSVTPASIPYRLDLVQGDVFISPHQVVLRDLKATHGNAGISISGTGQLGEHQAWALKVSAQQLTVDDELVGAVPDSVATVLKGLKVRGKVDVELSKLAYWPTGQAQGTTDGADVDFAAKITMLGTSLDIGLPATNVRGDIDLAGLMRGGRLHRLAGRCGADSLLLAGRAGSDFKLTLAKDSDEALIQISHVEGKFASGDLAGDGQYAFPDDLPSKYDLSLVLRDADVQQLTTPYEKDLRGRLTASLQLRGTWNEPQSRRGHGDVSVVGEKMYNIPVMLGLMQITNLALPLNSPFTEISTRYSLDGEKVVFEQIDLKSKDMTMSGSGEMNFALKSVSLWLTTKNAALVALPVVGPLIGGANQELLRIHIKGTIEEPKVTASTFGTVTTTVDQVFQSNN